jgi:hypothetical protein
MFTTVQSILSFQGKVGLRYIQGHDCSSCIFKQLMDFLYEAQYTHHSHILKPVKPITTNPHDGSAKDVWYKFYGNSRKTI